MDGNKTRPTWRTTKKLPTDPSTHRSSSSGLGKVLEGIGLISIGFLAFGGVLDALSNAQSVITFRVAVIGTIVLVAICTLVGLTSLLPSLRSHPGLADLRWTARQWYILAGILALLWAPSVTPAITGPKDAPTPPVPTADGTVPVSPRPHITPETPVEAPGVSPAIPAANAAAQHPGVSLPSPPPDDTGTGRPGTDPGSSSPGNAQKQAEPPSNSEVNPSFGSPRPDPIVRMPNGSPSHEEVFEVSTEVDTHLSISKGDLVQVEATGTIKMGKFIGRVDPDGLSGGWLAVFDANHYNLDPRMPHGMLLYRIGDEGDWLPCGSRLKFKAKDNGTLYFQINDRQQQDNTPGEAFVVKVRITGRSASRARLH